MSAGRHLVMCVVTCELFIFGGLTSPLRLSTFPAEQNTLMEQSCGLEPLHIYFCYFSLGLLSVLARRLCRVWNAGSHKASPSGEYRLEFGVLLANKLNFCWGPGTTPLQLVLLALLFYLAPKILCQSQMMSAVGVVVPTTAGMRNF